MSSTKVITGKVRLSYVNVFTPTAMNDNDEPKYNLCILISKDDTATLDKIKKAIEAAKIEGKAKLADKNGRIPNNIKLPLRDGDEDRPDEPACEGMFFINCSSKRKPGIVDLDLNPILDQEELYSGCYGRVSINFYAFNTNGNKGIAVGLNNIQKLAEGERLAGGSSADEDFGGDNVWDDPLM